MLTAVWKCKQIQYRKSKMEGNSYEDYGQQTIIIDTKVFNVQGWNVGLHDVPSHFKKVCRTLLENANIYVLTR